MLSKKTLGLFRFKELVSDNSRFSAPIHRDSIIFVLLAVISLWFPGRNSNSLLFVVSCVITAGYIFILFRDQREYHPFHLILFFYGIWILISWLMHHFAMSELGPSTYITVSSGTIEWGLMVNKILGIAYLLFPLFLFMMIAIFRVVDKPVELIVLIPVIFIPSLLIALYQNFVDLQFMNPSVTHWIHEISGLSADFNGFRISLFLLTPLSILGFIISENSRSKWGFGLLTLLLIFVLLLSRSRTGIAGFATFSVIFPAILIWVKGNLPKRWLMYGTCILAAVLLFGSILVHRFQDRNSGSTLLRRIQEKYTYLETFGFRKTVIATLDENSFLTKHSPSRTEMGRYAVMLTSLSPLSGWGPGGFWRNIVNLRFLKRQSPSFSENYRTLSVPKPLPSSSGWGSSGFWGNIEDIKFRDADIHQIGKDSFDNANNQYLQMSSEAGIPGSLVNIMLHLWPLWMVFRVRNRISNRGDRWAVGIGFVVVSIIMGLYFTGPHIISVDVLFILVVYLSVLFSIAMKYGYKIPNVNMKVLMVLLFGTTLFIVQGSYEVTFGKHGYKSLQKASWWPYGMDRNHYEREQWKEGSVIWCKRDAIIELPLLKPNVPESLSLQFVVSHPNIRIKPVKVEYGGKNGPKHEMVIQENAWKTVSIQITPEYILERKNPRTGPPIIKSIIISLDVSHTWIPKEWGINDDTRELGVAVLIPNFYDKN